MKRFLTWFGSLSPEIKAALICFIAFVILAAMFFGTSWYTARREAKLDQRIERQVENANKFSRSADGHDINANAYQRQMSEEQVATDSINRNLSDIQQEDQRLRDAANRNLSDAQQELNNEEDTISRPASRAERIQRIRARNRRLLQNRVGR